MVLGGITDEWKESEWDIVVWEDRWPAPTSTPTSTSLCKQGNNLHGQLNDQGEEILKRLWIILFCSFASSRQNYKGKHNLPTFSLVLLYERFLKRKLRLENWKFENLTNRNSKRPTKRYLQDLEKIEENADEEAYK